MEEIKNILDAYMLYFYEELAEKGVDEDSVVAFEIEDGFGIFYTTSGEVIKIDSPKWIFHEGVSEIQ